MKNRFYAINLTTGRHVSGGHCSREEAEQYITSKAVPYIILEDRRINPYAPAARILERVWARGNTLTSQEYETLSEASGLRGVSAEQHPPALYLALALSGQLGAWEDSGALPRFFTAPRSIP